MLQAAGVSNPDFVASFLREGAPVMGEIPPSGLFERQRTEQTKTCAEPTLAGKLARAAAHAGTKSSGDHEVDVAVWDRTQEEVSDGKASGPFTPRELDDMFQSMWIPVRRFGLRQGADIRPIDDFSEFGQNSTSSTWEKLILAVLILLCPF